MQFRVYQVNLSEVWLVRVTCYSREMLNLLSQMGITLHPESC